MLACDVSPLEIVLLIHCDEGKGSTYKIQQDMPTSQSSVMFLQKIHLLVKYGESCIKSKQSRNFFGVSPIYWHGRGRFGFSNPFQFHCCLDSINILVKCLHSVNMLVKSWDSINMLIKRSQLFTLPSTLILTGLVSYFSSVQKLSRVGEKVVAL